MEKCGKKQIIVKKVNRMRKKNFLQTKIFIKARKFYVSKCCMSSYLNLIKITLEIKKIHRKFLEEWGWVIFRGAIFLGAIFRSAIFRDVFFRGEFFTELTLR